MWSIEEVIKRIENSNIKLPEPFKTKWLNALRSGEYEQTTTRMAIENEEGEYSYCCLGVGAVVCGIDLFDSKNLNDRAIYDNGTATSLHDFEKIPKVFRDAKELQELLYSLNDVHNQSFEEIADIIEKYL